MMYFDDDGYPVNETKDGMDSAMRAGMLATFSFTGQLRMKLSDYEKDGLMVRHPKHSPSNNPWNFTRDQMIPLVAGLYFQREYKAVRRIFYAHVKRFFFSQNFERDLPGTKKYPWPHTFINDHGVKETRSFDFADPLTADHIWHLIWCGRIWPLFPFAIIGIPWFILSISGHKNSGHKEHNQLLTMCKAQGDWAIEYFKDEIPNWKADLREYWISRNEKEYALVVINDIDK